MQSANDLKQLLFGINHKSYPAYKSTRGAYQFPRYTLSIDHVQGDPFAAPSRVSVHINGKTAAFPTSLYDTYEKRVALQDYLLRQFARAIAPYSFRAKGSGKSGLLGVSRCGQEILERTACVLNPSDGSLIVNMEIGFPANGRTIASQELIRILFDFLPGCVEKSLLYRSLDPKACAGVARLCEDQQAIRAALKEKGLTALNRSPSSRQLKKYKFFLPVEIYLLAVFMQLASKFHVFPLVLKFQDSFANVCCCSNLYNFRSFLREYFYQ